MMLTGSPWIECYICGDDLPQILAVEHFKKRKLVCPSCADKPAQSDYLEHLVLPTEETDELLGKKVADQGEV